MIYRIITVMCFLFLSSKTFAEIGYGVEVGAAYALDSRVDAVIEQRNNAGMQNITSSYDDGAIFVRGYVSQSQDTDSSLEIGLFQATGFSTDYTVANETGSDDYNIAGVDFTFNLNAIYDISIKFGGHYSFIYGDDELIIGSTSHDIESTNVDGAGIVFGTGYNFGDIRTSVTYYGSIAGDGDSHMTVGTIGYSF